MNYVFDKLVAAGFSVVKQPCASGCTSGAGPNVIADWPGGNANEIYMFGAHLDSVSAGPGINDNAWRIGHHPRNRADLGRPKPDHAQARQVRLVD